MKFYMKFWAIPGLAIVIVLAIYLLSELYAPHHKPDGAEHREDITCPVTVANYAAKLRKENDSVHIFAVSNRYEVWCTHTMKGKWKDAATIEEARQIVDDYYTEWAKNCIGPTPPGKQVE